MKVSLRGNKSKGMILNATERFRCHSLASGQIRCQPLAIEQNRCFLDFLSLREQVGCSLEE